MADTESTPPPGNSASGAEAASAGRVGLLSLLLRPVLAVVGLIFIALSIPVGLASPLIPIGLPIGICGVLLLGRNSTKGRAWMESVMEKRPWVEKMAPKWLMRFVFEREKRVFIKPQD